MIDTRLESYRVIQLEAESEKRIEWEIMIELVLYYIMYRPVWNEKTSAHFISKAWLEMNRVLKETFTQSEEIAKEIF